jgi:hypothetical protein
MRLEETGGLHDNLSARPLQLFLAVHPAELKLPGKGRIIVWSVVNIEEWEITRPMARQLSIAPQGQSVIPDMPNWTWYEYGMRVGFWRLMRALKKAKVTPTMSLNAKVCETYPRRPPRRATPAGSSWRTPMCRCRSSRSPTGSAR